MKATLPVYIRFGELPEGGKSSVHASDEIICTEAGVSVWDCIKVNDIYYPVLPENPNEDAVADYFNMLFGDKKVYLVTGMESRYKGHDGEPCLIEPVVIKELPKYKLICTLERITECI